VIAVACCACGHRYQADASALLARGVCPRCASADIDLAELVKHAEVDYFQQGYENGKRGAPPPAPGFGQGSAENRRAYIEGWRKGRAEKEGSMHKGAPFAGYADFDACVAANQDKRDPEAYCGKIKHQVEDSKSSARLASRIRRDNPDVPFDEALALARETLARYAKGRHVR
jgi:hypothetical protein